jgi:hypothetical protein
MATLALLAGLVAALASSGIRAARDHAQVRR